VIMRARLLVNLALLALVALLAAVAFFEPTLDEPAAPPTLTGLTAQDVASLRIARSDGSVVAFERRDGAWWMVEPIEILASDYRVQAVVALAEAHSHARYAVADVDLAAVGLEPPEVRVTYNGGEELAFGGQSPLDQRRYVRVGDVVHLVDGGSYYHLVGHHASFVDTTLLPPGARIAALHLPGLDVTQRDGRWQVSPRPDEFSVDRVNALLEHWRLTRALQVSGHATDHHHGMHGDTARVEFADGRAPITFLIEAREPELVLSRPELGLSYRLTAESAERLFSLPTVTAPTP